MKNPNTDMYINKDHRTALMLAIANQEKGTRVITEFFATGDKQPGRLNLVINEDKIVIGAYRE